MFVNRIRNWDFLYVDYLICVIYICSNFNEVMDALVEAFRKFVTCGTIDIEKNSIGHMTGI